MIDFRYHVVSLVSVFIALAVGILLGAGPLQKPLEQGVSQTLQQQVESLRADRQGLRDQLDSSQAAVSHRDEVIAGITPQVVAGRLTGRTVVLVTLPDAATDRVSELTRTVTAAGGRVVGRVDVRAAWTDPAQAQTRQELAAKLVAGLPAGSTVPAGGEAPDTVLAGLLARAVTAPTRTVADTPDPAGVAILDGLAGAGLVRLPAALEVRGELVVVLAPGVEAATATAAASPSPSATASASPTAAAPSRPWNPLAVALDKASGGVVVMGPGSAATSGGVLADVRGDADLDGTVSGVDTGGTAMGDLTTVLALAEQASGGSGEYGFGDGASAALPPLTASAAVSDATATP